MYYENVEKTYKRVWGKFYIIIEEILWNFGGMFGNGSRILC